MNINRLCPGCMREMKNMAGRCPYCGYSAAERPNNTKCLPVNTILAGKYLVGRVLGQGGFGITYIGFNLNTQTRVAIKECFPVEVVRKDTHCVCGVKVLCGIAVPDGIIGAGGFTAFGNSVRNSVQVAAKR